MSSNSPVFSSFRKYKTILSVILLTLLALGIRIYYYNNTVINSPIRADAREYAIYSYNLLNHGTFSRDGNTVDPKPDGYRSPGFPILIALGMKLFGLKGGFYTFILTLHIIMGTLLVPLTFYTGRQVFNVPFSLLAALFVAISPHLVTLGGNFLTETSFAFFHLAALLMFLLALCKRHPPLFLISGFFFGYTYLINPVIQFLPFILLAGVILGERLSLKEWKDNDLIKGLAGFLIIFLFFTAGWGLRNRISLEEKTLRPKNRVINNLVIGSHYDFFSSYKKDPRGPKYKAVQQEIRQAGDSYSGFLKGFLPRFAEDPLRYMVWYSLEKPVLLYGWSIQFGAGDIYVYPVVRSGYTSSGLLQLTRLLMKKTHPLLIILFFAGMINFLYLAVFRRLRPDTPYALLSITMFYITFVYSILQSEPRFSIPFRPEFYLLSLFAARHLFLAITKRNPSASLVKGE